MSLLFLACICSSTDKSNIHNPSRDIATLPIKIYDDNVPVWIQIAAKQGSRQVHCIQIIRNHVNFVIFCIIVHKEMNFNI